jgi:hypothetical protein
MKNISNLDILLSSTNYEYPEKHIIKIFHYLRIKNDFIHFYAYYYFTSNNFEYCKENILNCIDKLIILYTITLVNLKDHKIKFKVSRLYGNKYLLNP